MEDKSQNEQKSKKEDEDVFMKTMRDIMGLKSSPKIPDLPINKKI